MDIVELESKTIAQLHKLAEEMKLDNFRPLRKMDLIFKLLETQPGKDGGIAARGVLEILPEGYGFLRTSGYLPSA